MAPPPRPERQGSAISPKRTTRLVAPRRSEALANAVEELTPRGLRTREALLDAARQVFERDGFLEARVTDISAAADMAHGTFYKYFDSKEQVFAEVVDRMLEATRQSRPVLPAESTPYERILANNRWYYERYRNSRDLNRVMEAVASFNEALQAQRLEARVDYVQRTERAIRRWQSEGLAHPDLDAHYAASGLCSMVDRTIYVWLVLGEEHDAELGIETLSRMWVYALGLDQQHEQVSGPGRRRSGTRKR